MTTNSQNSRARRLAALALMVTLVAACGGGGDSTQPPVDSSAPPEVPSPSPPDAPAPPPEMPPPSPPPEVPPPSPPPSDPAVASAIRQTITSSSSFVSALVANGNGLSWGLVADMLGTGSVLPGSAARTVSLSATSVAAGAFYTVAAGVDGHAYVWGQATTDGTLGNFAFNTLANVGVPTALPGLDSVVQVAATTGKVTSGPLAGLTTSYSMALRADGTVWHWPGTVTQDRSDLFNVTVAVAPNKVAGLDHVVALSRGGGQQVAIKDDGSAWAVTFNVTATSVTVATHTASAAQVMGLADILQASCASNNCLALSKSGKVYAWGDNTFGQLGNNSTAVALAPVEVQGLTGIAAVSFVDATSCALTSDGHIWFWGVNPGNGNLAPTLVPTLLTTIDGVVEFSECTHVMRRADGTVFGIGFNNAGLLAGGSGGAALDPVQAPGINLN